MSWSPFFFNNSPWRDDLSDIYHSSHGWILPEIFGLFMLVFHNFLKCKQEKMFLVWKNISLNNSFNYNLEYYITLYYIMIVILHVSQALCLSLPLEISPRPNIQLVSKPSKKAILSWQRQNLDEAEIVGYVIQVFHGSTQNFASIHVDDKRPHGKHTFSNTDTIKHALLRVCIRNTLCIFEQSCSRKVGLLPGKYKYTQLYSGFIKSLAYLQLCA